MTPRQARIILASDIARHIFANNEFWQKSRKDTAFVVGSKVMLQQSGGLPDSVMNNTVWPLAVTDSEDTVLEYAIDSYSTKPQRIGYAENFGANYDVGGVTADDHAKVLRDRQAKGIVYRWAATDAANIVRTTGAARAVTLAGATGTRKRTERKDLLEIKRAMDFFDIPEEDRQGLMSSTHLNDLLENEDLLGMWNLGERLKALGILKELCGFSLLMRSSVGRYTNAATPVPRNMAADNPTTAATDNEASLFWHPDFVRIAPSGVMTFINLADPTYQGDLFSAQSFLGASPAYTNKRGIYSLVEAATA